MTNQEKIMMIEEMLELEEGELNENIVLSDLAEWDSMAALSLIVLIDEEFEKKLTGKQIKEFKTVKDIMNFMES